MLQGEVAHLLNQSASWEQSGFFRVWFGFCCCSGCCLPLPYPVQTGKDKRECSCHPPLLLRSEGDGGQGRMV